MKKWLALFISLVALSWAFSYEESIEKKTYLSAIEEPFLSSYEGKEWICVIKEVGEKKVSFWMPKWPEQKIEKKKVSFQVEKEGNTYHLWMKSLSSKEDNFLQKWEEQQEKDPDFLAKRSYQNSLGKIIEIDFFQRKKQIVQTTGMVFVFETQGENVSPELHEKFVHSLQVIQPKKK